MDFPYQAINSTGSQTQGDGTYNSIILQFMKKFH